MHFDGLPEPTRLAEFEGGRLGGGGRSVGSGVGRVRVGGSVWLGGASSLVVAGSRAGLRAGSGSVRSGRGSVVGPLRSGEGGVRDGACPRMNE